MATIYRRTRSRSHTPRNLRRTQEEFMRPVKRQRTMDRVNDKKTPESPQTPEPERGQTPESPESPRSDISVTPPSHSHHSAPSPSLPPVLGLDVSELNRIHLNGNDRVDFNEFSRIGIKYPDGTSSLCLELRMCSNLMSIQPTEYAKTYRAVFHHDPTVTEWFEDTIDTRFQSLVQTHLGTQYQPIDLHHIDFQPTTTQFRITWMKRVDTVSFETIKLFCEQQKRIHPDWPFSVQLTLMFRHLIITNKASLKIDIIDMIFPIISIKEYCFIQKQQRYPPSLTPLQPTDMDEPKEPKPIMSKPPSRKQVTWPEGRDILVGQDFKCNNKNCRTKLDETMEMDHITPLHQGGPHARYNLQLLCPNCHRRKSKQERDMMNRMY